MNETDNINIWRIFEFVANDPSYRIDESLAACIENLTLRRMKSGCRARVENNAAARLDKVRNDDRGRQEDAVTIHGHHLSIVRLRDVGRWLAVIRGARIVDQDLERAEPSQRLGQ